MLTFKSSTAFLAGAQEALLGLHRFLGTISIPASRVKVGIFISRIAGTRGAGSPHAGFSIEALTGFYAALSGGAEVLMGSTVRHAPQDEEGPPTCPAGLAADLRRDVATADFNNLRVDLAHQREFQAMWADSLPGAVALVAAAGANLSFGFLPVPPHHPTWPPLQVPLPHSTGPYMIAV